MSFLNAHRVRWRLFGTFLLVVLASTIAWTSTSSWTPYLVHLYAMWQTVSIFMGIVFVIIAAFHIRQFRTTTQTGTGILGSLNVAGHRIDPILRAIAQAVALYASGSLMGRILLDNALAEIAFTERIAIVLTLAVLMFWSLRTPYAQFVATFIDGGTAASAAKGDGDNAQES